MILLILITVFGVATIFRGLAYRDTVDTVLGTMMVVGGIFGIAAKL